MNEDIAGVDSRNQMNRIMVEMQENHGDARRRKSRTRKRNEKEVEVVVDEIEAADPEVETKSHKKLRTVN